MSHKIFGVDLEAIVAQQKVEIPKIVSHTLDYLLDKKAHLEEGLFRIPGNSIKIAQLKKQFDADGTVDLFKQKDLDNHTAACLLKLYLRELPIPVVIPRYYSTYLKVYQNPDPKQRIINFRKLVLGLPKSHRALLISILGYLRLVSQNVQQNKMSALNLALIFAPNLMRAEKETLTSIMEDADKVAGTLQLLIQEVDYLATGTPPAWFEGEGNSLPLRSKAMSSPPAPHPSLKREETIAGLLSPDISDSEPLPTESKSPEIASTQESMQSVEPNSDTLKRPAKNNATPPPVPPLPPNIAIVANGSVESPKGQCTNTLNAENINSNSITSLANTRIPPLNTNKAEQSPPTVSADVSAITTPPRSPQVPNDKHLQAVKGRHRKFSSSQDNLIVVADGSAPKSPTKEKRSLSFIRSCSDNSLSALNNINEPLDEQIVLQSVKNMKALRGSSDTTNGKNRRRLSMMSEHIAKTQLFTSYQNLKSFTIIGEEAKKDATTPPDEELQ